MTTVSTETPRGPGRWRRAAESAFKRPNTKAAKLYFDRVTLARVYADAAPPDVNRATYVHENKRGTTRYYTCSLTHAMMQASLDLGTTDLERIALAVTSRASGGRDEWLVTPRVFIPLKSWRGARCQVCAEPCGSSS